MMIRVPAVTICAVTVALAACADIPDDELGVTSAQATVECPELGCNLNAASLGDGLFFHELHPAGHPNTVGVRYRRFVSPLGAPLTLHVVGDDLIGVDALGFTHQGGELIGARIFLSKDSIEYVLRIADVDYVQYWVGDGGQVPVYTFLYSKPSEPENREKVVCTTSDLEEGVPTTSALVFTGDRYDAVRKLVSGISGGWFNVACAGSAMAKMHLLRHTAAGQDPWHLTTVSQRTAMLKMLTDDICGTGRSFTVDGELVFYTDQRGWHPFQPPPPFTLLGQPESIWTDAGAICLDEPRRLAEDGIRLLDEIVTECGRVLPSCGGLVPSWTSHGYGFTRNPLVLTLP